MHPLKIFGILALTLAVTCSNVSGQSQQLSSGAFKASYEQVHLPGNEDMGMLGTGVYREFRNHFSVGVASYSAVDGQRGGFITLGADLGIRLPLPRRFELDAGTYVGAGGGRGGYTVSGGGLFLRTHGGLNYRLARLGKFGGGISFVDTPTGRIQSVQPYLSYSLPFYTLTESGWRGPSEKNLSGDDYRELNPKLHEVTLTTRALTMVGEKRTDARLPQRDFSLIGAQWRTHFNEHVFGQVQSEAGVGGSSAGYMHVLVGAGIRQPLAKRVYASVSASVGGGGGGNVDTGGGLLVDGSAGLQFFLTQRWFVDATGGYLRAPAATFEAATVGFRLGYQLGAPHPGDAASRFAAHKLRVRFVNQHYFQAANRWRTHHANEGVDNLGVQVDYFLNPHWFLTGQGIAAYNGNAGAYMTGLVGGGYRHRVWRRLFVEGEGLAGAAAGGGLAFGPGVALQANASAGVEVTNAMSLMVTGGELKAADGPFRAHVLGVSLAYHLRSFTRK